MACISSLFCASASFGANFYFTRGAVSGLDQDHSLSTLKNYSTTVPTVGTSYYAASTPAALPGASDRICIGAYSAYAGETIANGGYIQMNSNMQISCLDISSSYGNTNVGIAAGIAGTGTLTIRQIDGGESVRQNFSSYGYVDFDIAVNTIIDTSSRGSALFWRPGKTLTFSGDTTTITGTNDYNLYYSNTASGGDAAASVVFDTKLVINNKFVTQAPNTANSAAALWNVTMKGSVSNEISTAYVVRTNFSILNLEKSGGAEAFNAGSTLVISRGGTVNVNGAGQFNAGANIYISSQNGRMNLNGNSVEINTFGISAKEPITGAVLNGSVDAKIDFGAGHTNSTTFKFSSFNGADADVAWSGTVIEISNFDADKDFFLSGEKLSELIVDAADDISAMDLLAFVGHDEVYEFGIQVGDDLFYAYSYQIPEPSEVAMVFGVFAAAFAFLRRRK